MKTSLHTLLVIAMMALSFPCITAGINDTVTANTPLSKSDQWHNLLRWVSLTFDGSNVIDMQDAERGTMIIKWSCPVKLDSELMSASVMSTYVIDVRDGRYRLQRVNPRVVFHISQPDVFEAFENGRDDIRLISGIASRVYGGSLEWPADEQYDDVIEAYRLTMQNTDQYRNDRDRERGKISDERRKAEHNWRLVRTPLTVLKQMDEAMAQSLDKSLRENDDF